MTYMDPKVQVQTLSSQIPCLFYQYVVTWKDLTSDFFPHFLFTLSSILLLRLMLANRQGFHFQECSGEKKPGFSEL